MKRNTIVFFLSLVLLLALATPAAADVLWEPYDNDYYLDHFVYTPDEKDEYSEEEAERFDKAREALTVVSRVYFVPEGMTVNLYSAPEDGRLLTTLEAGSRVYIGFSNKINGEVWGVGYTIGDNAQGWCRLGRLQLEYDSWAFSEDFQDQFTDYTGQMDSYEVKDRIYVWTYPGSGVQEGVISEIHPSYNDGKLECNYVYTDPEGGAWGYVGYYMGHRDWIYLSDPENPNPVLPPGAGEHRD